MAQDLSDFDGWISSLKSNPRQTSVRLAASTVRLLRALAYVTNSTLDTSRDRTSVGKQIERAVLWFFCVHELAGTSYLTEGALTPEEIDFAKAVAKRHGIATPAKDGDSRSNQLRLF
jgi:hypothetical protein